MRRGHHQKCEGKSGVRKRASDLLGKTKWLPEIYKRASKCSPDLTGRRQRETLRATSRVLTWLDLAEPNKGVQTGYEATSFLVQRIARLGLEADRVKSSKQAASYVDIDVIESLLEGGVGADHCSVEVRGFVCDVLGVLGLVRFTEGGEPIPARVLRKLVSVCRQQDRYRRSCHHKETEMAAEKQDVDQWLAIRREVGRRIDPEVAEVASWHAYTLDPYGVCSDLPEEAKTFGRERFARSARSDVWVLSDDLPGTTRAALSKLDRRR
jgi:hypothetical protein